MQRNVKALVVAATSALALGTLLMLAAPSSAQQDASTPGALPTAAGAERTSQGGLSSAPASLPGAPGTSPLEPYLVTWLLPVSGIIAVGMGIFTDRLMRQRHPTRASVTTRAATRPER